MRNSLYSEIARSAALHENAGSLNQAAKLWRQANELAVLKDNVDWTAHRAHVCEARLRLAAKAARVRNGGQHSPCKPSALKNQNGEVSQNLLLRGRDVDQA